MFGVRDMVGSGPTSLSEKLEGLAPGAELAAMLADVDLESVSGFDSVNLLKGWSRLISYAQAGFYRTVRAVWEAERAVAHRGFDALHSDGLIASSEIDDLAVAEIRAALGWTRRTAESHLDLAFRLSRLPEVEQALAVGAIDLPKARVLCDETAHVEEEEAREIVARVLPHAARLTTGQLRARLRRLCMEADPQAAKNRYEARIEDRRVVVEANEDGAADFFGLNLPPAPANAALARIDQIARKLKTKGEQRTLDQLRADVFLDLLCGNDHHAARAGGRAVVDIRVDLETLAGLAESAGEIPGYGPVIADVARQVAENQEKAEWRVVVSDDVGQVIDVVTTRRRPTAAQRRWIESFCPDCVFPTCRRSAGDCDLDHNTPWAQTRRTATRGLAPLCRHDHHNKENGWSYRQIRPGVWEWTSPLGHKYLTHSDPYRDPSTPGSGPDPPTTR